MYFLNKCPLAFCLTLFAFSTASAVPVSNASSNITAVASANTTAALINRYPNCYVNYLINFEIVDDETWPIPDEISRPQHTGRWNYLYQEGFSFYSPSYQIVEKLGGEVRVELEFRFETYDVWGHGTMFYEMRLYEGDSEETTDRDGFVQGTAGLTTSGDVVKISVLSEEWGSADRASAEFILDSICLQLN